MSAVVVSSSYQETKTFNDYGSGASAVGVVKLSRQSISGVRLITEPSVSKQSTVENDLRSFMVTKKLKGFVSQNDGETWRVMFIVDGKEVPYDLPASRLHKAGIQARYQPFEMDELQPTSPNISGKVYRFRPLAKATDVFLETLPLDSERQRKYDLVIAHLGKSKS